MITLLFKAHLTVLELMYSNIKVFLVVPSAMKLAIIPKYSDSQNTLQKSIDII